MKQVNHACWPDKRYETLGFTIANKPIRLVFLLTSVLKNKLRLIFTDELKILRETTKIILRHHGAILATIIFR